MAIRQRHIRVFIRIIFDALKGRILIGKDKLDKIMQLLAAATVRPEQYKNCKANSGVSSALKEWLPSWSLSTVAGPFQSLSRTISKK
jgi:hypothetical protein